MSRPTVSFTKRQREQSKREKQAEKAAKRAQRKIEKTSGPGEDSLEITGDGIVEDVDAEPVHAPAE